MKRIIKTAGILACIAIIIFQVFRLKEAHKVHTEAYLENLKQHLNNCLEEASYGELVLRMYQSGAPWEEWENFDPKDTVVYLTRTIETMDTLFTVRFHRWDVNAVFGIKQFIFKGFNPVNPAVLDSLFLDEMGKKYIHTRSCYTEYVDVKTEKVIAHSLAEKPEKYYATGIFPIDIIRSVGLKGYADVVFPTVRDTLTSEYFSCGITVLSIIGLLVLVIIPFK